MLEAATVPHADLPRFPSGQVQHLLRNGGRALEAIQSRVGAGVKVDIGGDCFDGTSRGHAGGSARADHTLASTGRCSCGAEKVGVDVSSALPRVSHTM